MTKLLPPTILLSGADSTDDSDSGKSTTWRRKLLASVLPGSGLAGLQAAARQFQAICPTSPEGRGEDKVGGRASEAAVAVLDSDPLSPHGGEPAELFEEMVHSDAAAAERLARAVTSLPEVGGQFLGFRLVALLGKGTFGQVYLAEQGDLANRLVVLKVAADIFGESQTLAQLQHTNIVPIYSIHRADPFQAVCMPYFGATTLADILQHLDGGKSLPHSGKMLVSTVNDRKLSTRRSLNHQSSRQLCSSQGIRDRVAGAGVFGSPGPSDHQPDGITGASEDSSPGHPARTAAAALALQRLEGMTYVEAILSLVAGLADGLAHAHERGILHRDLKPANILLTEDGQAMLLDFNLSEDTKLRATATAASIGGTLPYMAPEHLQAFRGGGKQLDARSDTYSLGVILYELLTGRPPFPTYGSHPSRALDRMIEDRRWILPDVRRHNALVSPAVASIVRHCLEANPARRYQSARELQEDLERHLHHRQLKYAPEPCWRERLQKWGKRHPRLASATTIATVLGVLLAGLGTALVVRDRKLARFEAAAGWQQFQQDVQDVQFKLYSRHIDRRQLQEGIDRCLSTLGRFHVLDNPQWRQLPGVRNLPLEDQKHLEQQAGELLFLLSRATVLDGQYYSPPASRQQKIQDAQNYNLLAEACFGKGNCPKALWEQRADLARLLGRDREAEQLAALGDQVGITSARDYYLIAHKRTVEGNYRSALELLRQTTQQEPGNFSAWFVRGNCYYELLQDAQAVACYNTCVALRPEFHWSWFNRGLAHLRLRDYRQAWDDFDACLRLQPDLAEAYIQRALAKKGLAKFQEAIDDYTRALKGGHSLTRVYFLRAEARARAGDKAGAERDFALGLAGEPTDEAGWIARGLAKQGSDVAGALADFEQALRLNPRSFEGLQNKAAALDRLGKDRESLQVMEETVKLYPDSALARGGRGVLLARIHQRDRAVADARASLLLDLSPATLYQVACIYSLTSRENSEDKREALHLLASALRGGFGLDIVDTDADFDRLRALPEFKEAVAAAKLLQARAGGPVSQ